MAIESFAKIKRTHVVKEQLPSFVVEEHATFVKFLEAYYEFLSEKQFVTSERLVDYLDLDTVPDQFLSYFWEEIKEIPGNIVVDKRLLIKHIRDLYASKGTRKSIELLFRILFNEDISIYEPKDDVLRASDGKWFDKKIIRTKLPRDFDLNSLNGKKLYQFNDFSVEMCQFIVADVKVIATDQIYMHVEITPASLIGAVYAERPLFNSTKSVALEIVQSYIVDSYQKRGSLYKSGDLFYSGLLPCYVENVGTGPVDDMFIIDGGTGYVIGDYLTVDENGTGGAGLSIIVTEIGSGGTVTGYRIINHGRGYDTLPHIVGNGTGIFRPYSSTIGKVLKVSVKEPTSDNNPLNLTTRAIVSSTSGLSQGEALYHYQDRLSNENGMNLLMEDGSRFLSEVDVTESFIGNIYQIENPNTITIRNNFGSGHFLLENSDSVIVLEDNSKFSTETNTIDLGNYTVRSGDGNQIFSILFVNHCKISTKLDPIFTVSSSFANEDGFVGYPTKKIEDSLFYQDFSYVIRSAQSFDTYKNVLYKMIHPAGMAVFGEVNINTYVQTVNGRIKQAFDDFKTITEALITLTTIPRDTSFVCKIESTNVLGTTYEFLEKYKFLLGDNYSDGTYGVSADLGGATFNRSAQAGVQNWKISDFANVRFTDIYDYDADYYADSPLVLDGSFILDGSQRLTGVKPATITSSVGKYRFRKDKRFTFTHGAEIRISPSYPIQDIVTVSDSISYVFGSIRRDTLSVTDSIVKQASFIFNVPDSITAVDNASGLRTFNRSVTDTTTTTDRQVVNFNKYQVDTITIVDRISRLDMNAPKDTANSVDVVTWILSSAVSINTNSFNTGTI